MPTTGKDSWTTVAVCFLPGFFIADVLRGTGLFLGFFIEGEFNLKISFSLVLRHESKGDLKKSGFFGPPVCGYPGEESGLSSWKTVFPT
jgi:hypothetical protein